MCFCGFKLLLQQMVCCFRTGFQLQIYYCRVNEKKLIVVLLVIINYYLQ